MVRDRFAGAVPARATRANTQNRDAPLRRARAANRPIADLRARGCYATDLLTAAVAHFGVFGLLAQQPRPFAELRGALGLAERPATVLITALRAFGLLVEDERQRLELTAMAREHLVAGASFDVSGYVGLAAESPGVVAMVKLLRSNRAPGSQSEETGAAFIYREGIESAMEREASARRLTLALAGRAKNVAPVLAERYPLEDGKVLLDVGGGTGIYSIAWLQRYPHLCAIVWDRPEVLKVAAEMADSHGVADRLECRAGDMFRDPLPAGIDTVLLSNVLHDWDVPECRALIARCAAGLPPGGRLLVHDVFLNDALDGPLPIALYSAALFSLTEGRAYSAGEYRSWLREAGLVPGELVPTLIHCGVLPSVKRSTEA
jgi:ubiquinone/menaquinone biosynthesis C-methylase UbiE